MPRDIRGKIALLVILFSDTSYIMTMPLSAAFDAELTCLDISIFSVD
jgi:hypothetical protein